MNISFNGKKYAQSYTLYEKTPDGDIIKSDRTHSTVAKAVVDEVVPLKKKGELESKFLVLSSNMPMTDVKQEFLAKNFDRIG